MVDKMCMLEEKILQRIEQDMQNINRFDVNTVGELIDMVKDLAEAVDHCKQAEYYKTVTKAMKTGEHDDASREYSHVIDPIKTALQNVSPEDRASLRHEIIDAMNSM